MWPPPSLFRSRRGSGLWRSSSGSGLFGEMIVPHTMGSGESENYVVREGLELTLTSVSNKDLPCQK